MLELMKFECKKYLSKGHYFFVILLMLIGIIGSILLIREGTFYKGNGLFIQVLGGMRTSTALSILIGGYVGVSLFGEEIRNSYVLPQGRRKILLSKLYITTVAIGAVYIPANIFKLVIFNQYAQGQWGVILSLIIANFILAISVTSVVITLALIFKSKILNQWSSIVAAGITYLFITYGVFPITAEALMSPVTKYVGTIILITIISTIAYIMAFQREVARDV